MGHFTFTFAVLAFPDGVTSQYTILVCTKFSPHIAMSRLYFSFLNLLYLLSRSTTTLIHAHFEFFIRPVPLCLTWILERLCKFFFLKKVRKVILLTALKNFCMKSCHIQTIPTYDVESQV